jgi:hypothetical protein
LKAPDGNYFEKDFTLIIWFKLDSFSSLKNSVLINFNNNNTNKNQTHISIKISENRVVLKFNSKFFFTNQSNVILDNWNLVSVTVEKENLKFYLNDKLQKTFCNDSSNILYFENLIGKNDEVNSSSIYIDDIQIFNRSLNQFDIKKNAIYSTCERCKIDKSCKYEFGKGLYCYNKGSIFFSNKITNKHTHIFFFIK